LIEQRYAPKTVNVSKVNGFSIVKKDDQTIPLEKLSSGEQHQLVLYFELLFELKPNALILIDEPELSLHVAWQKKFIGDLQTIIVLNKFDVVLATHSPQLIGRWPNLVVELGEVDDHEIH
jgi:predicted ATP-binding protein involved in virulence